MFCVVILFILSNTHFLSHILLGTNCISEKTFSILRPIYSLLYVINSSVNLFIYIYFNNKFRGHFIAIFSCTKTNYRGVSTRASGTTTVAPEFSDTLTLFQPRGAYSTYQPTNLHLYLYLFLVHAQHSCACTTLLCMHWRGQGPRPGPKKSAGGPACMHKSVVHAQECCACTRN